MPDTEPHHDNPFDTDLQVLHSKDFFARMKSTVTEKILRPSGRENLIQSVWNAAKGLVSVIAPIKDAFRDIFPPATSDQLYALTETLRSFSERLTISDETADKLQRTFKGLFSMLDLGRQAIMAVVNAVMPMAGGILEPTQATRPG